MPNANAVMVAFWGRPATGPLVLAILAMLMGWGAHVWFAQATRRGPLTAEGETVPEPLEDGSHEPAAIVGLITGGALTRAAITATVLDLASRGWLHLDAIDGEVAVVTRGRGQGGDVLHGFEQHVVNHIGGVSYNNVTTASSLAIAQPRITRRWMWGFERATGTTAAKLGLTRDRYNRIQVALPAALCAVGLIALWLSMRGSTSVPLGESWLSRVLGLTALAGIVGLGYATFARERTRPQVPTELGAHRAARWLGYRRRLQARIPPHASVIGPPRQQLALARGTAMGIADQTLDQIPIAPDSNRLAWTESGETPHLVHVRYPMRPGYGYPPLGVGIGGVVALVVFRLLRNFFNGVANGTKLSSWLDKIPGQRNVFETLAQVLAVLCWIPILFAVWAIIAGCIDSLTSVDRVGWVVRTRRPVEVVPMPSITYPLVERARGSGYVAVDDGKRNTVIAWYANRRATSPQGTQARVRATPLLGYVRSAEPVGTSAARTTRPASTRS